MSAPEYVKNLVTRMATTFSSARENLRTLQRRNKIYYDNRAPLRSRKFETGDLVMVLNSATKVGRSKKLQPIWKGPYIVTEVLSDILYGITSQRKTTVQHVDRMRLYIDRTVPLWVQRRRTQLVDNCGGLEATGMDQLEDIGLQQLFSQESDPAGDHLSATDPNSQSGYDEQSLVLSQNDQEDIVPLAAVEPPTRRTRAGRQTRLPSHLQDYCLN